MLCEVLLHHSFDGQLLASTSEYTMAPLELKCRPLMPLLLQLWPTHPRTLVDLSHFAHLTTLSLAIAIMSGWMKVCMLSWCYCITEKFLILQFWRNHQITLKLPIFVICMLLLLYDRYDQSSPNSKYVLYTNLMHTSFFLCSSVLHCTYGYMCVDMILMMVTII